MASSRKKKRLSDANGDGRLRRLPTLGRGAFAGGRAFAFGRGRDRTLATISYVPAHPAGPPRAGRASVYQSGASPARDCLLE